MLGTGHATVTKCFNACFALQAAGATLLVDGGGGNGILAQLEKAQIQLPDIDAIFVTHAHTDHVMGVLWVVRMFGQQALYDGNSKGCTVYASRKVLDLLDHMGSTMLYEVMWHRIREVVRFREVNPGSSISIAPGFSLTCFDTHASEPQMGFRAALPDGQTVVCCGDAPIADIPAADLNAADWLIAEAYCLERDEARFHARAKHHGTVSDTARIAACAGCRRLIIYHTEDTDLAGRKESYTREARLSFPGEVYVPDDLDIIPLL